MKFYNYYKTKIGTILIEEDENKISRLTIAKENNIEGIKKETPLIKKAFIEVKEYLDGKRKEFDLPLLMKGTPFQIKVWEALKTIPYGETRCYQEIARQIGNEKAVRAVGGANHNNQIMIVIPCHRVIGKNKKLVGFGAGLDVKEALLEIEKNGEYMNKKILVSDYDQTFYLNDEDIEKNKKAVNIFRNEGNIFVIATGRSYFDFYNIVNLYNFKYDYVIINHGATILDKDNNIFANFYIKNEIINSIKEDLQLEKSVKWYCCSKLQSIANFEHKDLTKINVRYNSKEEAMLFNKIINSKYSNYINSYYVPTNSIEIISNKTNKSKAIDLLLKELDILNKNIYAIGDGYSDIEMIKDFNGYAMINSVDELKSIAKKKYKSVSELINEIM